MLPQNAKRGRPVYGAEEKSVVVRIRIEPYLNDQMTATCKRLGMTKSAFVRYAIEQLIKSIKMNRQY